MSQQSQQSGPLLDAGPRPGGTGAYDEFFDGGVPRPHWAFLAELVTRADDAQAASLDATVRRLVDEHALTYLTDGQRRPWRLDPLPFMLSSEDWTQLEAGLIQRAELLNAIVADLYGEQQLFQQGLPLPLAFANPEYLLPSCGYHAPAGTYLHVLAFDLGRSPDGRWRILNNRSQSPSGLGFSLENRMILARSSPELFSRGNIARLAQFFRRFSDHLQSLGRSCGTDDGLSVILTAGPEQSTYSEHTYLGRYLGFPVVEGADLTVRGGEVFLKTLEGLKRINMIWRQISSADCDPLELNAQSLLGTPGLLRAAAQGNVLMANAIGSGVVENDAIMSFLPALNDVLFDRKLTLPSLATWWCGQPKERRHVEKKADRLVLRRAFAHRPLLESTVDGYLATDLTGKDAEAFQEALDAMPYAFVGREPIALSTVPYWDGERGWQSAPMTLRLYVTASDDGYQVMPGGLARVATPAGDISKDVWVAAAQGDDVAFVTTRTVSARRSDRDLPSRTADDLFWLGRYLERTESAVRLYRSLFRYVAGEASLLEQPVALSLLTRLLAAMDLLSPHRARRAAQEGRVAVEQELWNILFDPESDDGLAKVLANVHRTAEHVRERLSGDAWRLFESLSAIPTLRWRVHGLADVVRLLDDLIEKISALNGQIVENMTRGHGWRLLDAGRRIERTRYSVRVIRDLCTGSPQEVGALALLLDLSDNTITHRARYQNHPTLTTVLDLLLVDNSNPRSVIFQIETLQSHLATMPLENDEGQLSESARLLLAAHSDLALADVDKLVSVVSKRGVHTHLARLLKRIEQNMIDLHQVITRTYFDHTEARQR